MILPILKYGNPMLRRKGARIEAITPAVTDLIGDMFETMYKAPGIGLAAQQVGQALQLCVIDVRGITDRPSTLEIDGEAIPVESIMPLALINPQITAIGEMVTGPEGCLSFPEIYADVARAEAVLVKAQAASGHSLEFRAGGLLGRAIQHEIDHLNGILFIDRMASNARAELRGELEELQESTREALKRK